MMQQRQRKAVTSSSEGNGLFASGRSNQKTANQHLDDDFISIRDNDPLRILREGESSSALQMTAGNKKRSIHIPSSRLQRSIQRLGALGLVTTLLCILLVYWSQDPASSRLWHRMISFSTVETDNITAHYRSLYEQSQRRLRFPSVQDRVQLYMSNWYVPPCSREHTIRFALRTVPSLDHAVPLLRKTSLEEQKPNSTSINNHEVRQIVVQGLNQRQKNDVYILQDDITMAQIIALEPSKVRSCEQNEYCPDIVDYMLPALEQIEQEGNDQYRSAPPLEEMDDEEYEYWSHIRTSSSSSMSTARIPLLAQFGDSLTIKGYNAHTKEWDSFPHIPIFMKFRLAFANPHAIAALTVSDCRDDDTAAAATRTTSTTRFLEPPADSIVAERYGAYYQPIVWKLTSLRHFSMIPSIAELDIPYESKMDMAVFRGALTGISRDGYKHNQQEQFEPKDRCLHIHRCRLVYQTAHSPLIDAKLVGKHYDVIPPEIEGVDLYGEKFSYSKILQYKAVIMLEGNDISSGFKWALYSNSVVLAQPPTKTSWAMEELLEPWIHYIPLNKDLSDVEEKVQWILDNPTSAQRIAQAGSLWIRDLLFHPDAKADDEAIYEEMIRRYRAHFVYDSTLLDLQQVASL